MSYADAAQSVRDIAKIVRTPVRMTVADAAKRYVRIRTPSGSVAAYDPSITPYMIDPMNALQSRVYEAVIFAGPAQSGKTQGLVDGWVAHTIACDPGDMQIVQTSELTARDFSRLRINRMFAQSDKLKEYLSSKKSDDNVYDKWLKSGAILKLSWPSVSQLSGRSMKKMALTDYDRMPENIDKEGSAFSMAQQRIKTFMSRGMVMAESSPGYTVEDPNWQPGTLHEAPPTKGILSLYNLGTRRRLYWVCPHCKEAFLLQPGIEGFSFRSGEDLFGVTDAQIVGDVGVKCTTNGCEIAQSHKVSMNLSAIWVADGCVIDREGSEYHIIGDPPKTKIDSYWLHGVAAAYQSWASIVQNYLNAKRTFEITGDEELLKTTVNTDQGNAYLPQHLAEEVDESNVSDRVEDVERLYIDEKIRVLFATVDVQGGKNKRFVVQVVGVGPQKEKWLIDRYDIKKTSANIDASSTEIFEPQDIDPAKYVEHWQEITKRVVNSTYKLSNGKELRIYRTAVDTGGEDGVQDRAYDWWRSLKLKGLHTRVHLIKGKGGNRRVTESAPKALKSYPDSRKRSDRKSNARGDIPVYQLNTNKLKDAVNNDLKRDVVGPGYIHFPKWIAGWFYQELKAERRDDMGRWNKVSARNEAFDLFAYLEALLFIYKFDEKIDWSAPPLWAAAWESNSEVMTREERVAMKSKPQQPLKRKGRRVISKGL
ncbi:MAG: phage terminase large subunit family protein [Gammaproteobacteria bacterium]|nr:phage terminase large subunit family protein [Gammaproteobacteria bacterium]